MAIRIGDNQALHEEFTAVIAAGFALSGGGFTDVAAVAWEMGSLPGGPILDEFIHRSHVRVQDGREFEKEADSDE